MKCSQVRQMISRYVDQDLDEHEETSLKLHADACPACKEALEQQMIIHGLFASVGSFEAPYGFATSVIARIDEELRRASFWHFFTLQPVYLRAVEVAFALVIIVVGMVSGNLIVASKSSARPLTVQESFSLDLFQTTPPDSIGGLYVRLAEVTDEK